MPVFLGMFSDRHKDIFCFKRLMNLQSYDVFKTSFIRSEGHVDASKTFSKRENTRRHTYAPLPAGVGKRRLCG